jgi:glycosyltransferase involved in cell wall biosynthesis
MRISFVLSSLELSGGVNVVVEYANRLALRGHQVSLLIPGGTIDHRIQAHIIPKVTLIESKAKLSSTRSPFQLLQITVSMTRMVSRGDVVVATHTPTVVPALLASLFGRKGHRVWLYMDYKEMFADRPIEKFLLKHAPKWFEQVVVISKACRHEMCENAQVESIVVGLGLNQPELLTVKSGRLASKIKRVLYIGDSRPRKGLNDFLAAAKLVYQQIPELRLSIVSKGSCEIKTEVPFDFLESPSRQELGELYRNSNLFVSASWAEGFGLPPLEAMACGTPVVLTNSRGVLDYARPNENCLMVPPRNPGALAEAMLRVLIDEELSDRLRANGPITARTFNWVSAVDRFETALMRLVHQ